jgi:predicted lipoprotein with Yx(FWY)xxD motif
MTRIPFLAAATVVSLTALALAACGGSSATGSAAPPKTDRGRPATVGVANNGSLGKILDDTDGRTLYLFAKDAGTKSACTAACASAWPPLRVSGKPTVGAGGERLDRWHDFALRRQAAGHLQRAPALHLHR